MLISHYNLVWSHVPCLWVRHKTQVMTLFQQSTANKRQCGKVTLVYSLFCLQSRNANLKSVPIQSSAIYTKTVLTV